MTDKKLTDNFRLSEFVDPSKVNDFQVAILQVLANELQVVRNRLQEFKSGMKPVCITITSGVRTQADITRLKKQGYNPSENSDHLCGLQTKALPTLGAADIQVYNCSLSMKKIALFIKELVTKFDVDFGQVIYEKNPKNGSEWIHLGNSPSLIFKDTVAKSITRKQFLMSTDNGKSYKVLK